MKRIFVVLLFLLPFMVSAQSEKTAEKRGFQKDKLFTGGGITLSIANNGLAIGATPVFGYSLAKWIDAGILFNFIYSTNRHVVYTVSDGFSTNYIFSDDKTRETLYGPGVFTRIYPVSFLFAQVQAEKNFIRQKLIFAPNSPYPHTEPYEIFKYSPASLLVGGGYCQGREGSGEMFYYVSILFDVAKNENSPYVERTASGTINVLPIIRAGLHIPLFQKN